MIIKTLVVGPILTNCYLLADEKTCECAIIDPGGDAEIIKREIALSKLKPKFIINTHGHFDHIAANGEFDLPIYVHRDDARFLGAGVNLLAEGDAIELGDLTLKVIHLPGHTPGGMGIKVDGVVFVGDSLFHRGVGRTDFPYASEENLLNSIKTKLLRLPDKTKVYPGHGPATTIGKERAYFA